MSLFFISGRETQQAREDAFLTEAAPRGGGWSPLRDWMALSSLAGLGDPGRAETWDGSSFEGLDRDIAAGVAITGEGANEIASLRWVRDLEFGTNPVAARANRELLRRALPGQPTDWERYFRGNRDAWARERRANTVDPATRYEAANLIGGLARMLTTFTTSGVAFGPAGLVVAGTGLGRAEEESLLEQGVDPETARRSGIFTGATMAAMGFAPVALPGRVLLRMATGAGINAAFGVGLRGGMNAYLTERGYGEGSENNIAQYYRWNDPHAAAIDIALGAAFGGLFGRRAMVRPHAGPDAVVTEIAPEPVTLPATAEGLIEEASQYANDEQFAEAYAYALLAREQGHPEAEDLIRSLEEEASAAELDRGRAIAEDVIAQDQAGAFAREQLVTPALVEADTMARETALGVPVNQASRRWQSEALRRAEEQIANDEAIDVGPVPDDVAFVPRPDVTPEHMEIAIRAFEEEAQANKLDDLAEEIRQLRESRPDVVDPQEDGAMFSMGRRRGVDPQRGSERFHDERLNASQNKAVEMARNNYTNIEIAEELETSNAVVGQYLATARRLGIAVDIGAHGVRGVNPRTGEQTATIEEIVRLRDRLIAAGHRNYKGRGPVGALSVNQIIAQRLGLSPQTVKVRLSRYNADVREGRREPLYSRGARPIFESVVERVVAESPTARASGAQWWATISKAKGVKREELEWIGLEDFLKAREGQISREDVLAFVRANGVRVEETVLGDTAQRMDDADIQRQLLPLLEERQRLRDEQGQTTITAARDNEIERRLDVIDPQIEALYAKRDASSTQTRWSQYTLPGGPLARDTEILTRTGWKRMDEVAIGDIVMTRRDGDGGLEWQPVEATPTVYAEKLYHFASESIDMRVTPCHQMVVKRRRRSGKCELFRITAAELWAASECLAPLTGVWADGAAEPLFGLDAGDVAEFVGWYVAEGSAVTSRIGTKSTLSIAQSRVKNPAKCDRLEALFNRLGFSWNFVESGPAYYIGIKSMPRGLVDLLHEQGTAETKHVPQLFFDVPRAVVERLLEALILGGSTAHVAGRQPRTSFFSKSKRLADDVQVLALLAGKRASVRQRETGLYVVNLNRKEWSSIDDAKAGMVDYNDTAFCVTVKNHAIYVRTNGVAAFTGNSNYRELLLRLPERLSEQDIADQARIAEIIEKIGPGNTVRDLLGDPRAQALHNERAGLEQRQDQRRRANFRSSHFDQPNVLAHVRFNERTDAEGKRTLFIEEVQSDWHQAGRERGYKAQISEARREALLAERAQLEPERNAIHATVNTSIGRRTGADFTEALYAELGRNERYTELSNRLNEIARDLGETTSIPDAPFKNNAWASLSMKRMIRWAAENGFEQIAWIRGQHALDIVAPHLDKKVGRITSGGVRSGDLHLIRMDNVEAEAVIARNGLGKAYESGGGGVLMSREQVLGTFGKELGERVLALADGESLGGVDFRTGGEGMRKFYDEILRNIANDLGKKFGARVGETQIAITPEAVEAVAQEAERIAAQREAVGETGDAQDWRDQAAEDRQRPTGVESVHSLPITPEMREQALEGQPLFSQGRQGVSGVEALIAEAEAEFGADWGALSWAGKVEVVQASRDVPAEIPRGAKAVHLRDTRTTYFIANNIRPGEMRGLILHEIGVHHGFEAMLGKRGFKEVLRQIEGMVETDHPDLVEARDHAERYAAHEDHVPEETLAYLIEFKADLPLVQSVLSRIRQWLIKTFGSTFGMRLTVDDLRALAITSLRRVAEQARREGAPEGYTEVLVDPRYSSGGGQGPLFPQLGANDRGILERGSAVFRGEDFVDAAAGQGFRRVPATMEEALDMAAQPNATRYAGLAGGFAKTLLRYANTNRWSDFLNLYHRVRDASPEALVQTARIFAEQSGDPAMIARAAEILSVNDLPLAENLFSDLWRAHDPISIRNREVAAQANARAARTARRLGEEGPRTQPDGGRDFPQFSYGRRDFEAAVRDPETGRVYTGLDHSEAIESAPDGVRERLHAIYDAPVEDPSVIGFRVNGQFMSREDGLATMRLGARRRDPIESRDYQERLRALRDGLEGERQGGAGEAARERAASVRRVARNNEDGGPVRSDARSGEGPSRALIRSVLEVSGVQLATKPKGNGLFGEYRATIDTPIATEADAVLKGSEGVSSYIDFELRDGSNKSEAYPGLHIRLSSLNHGARGQKVGVWFYRQLIEWADRQGFPVYSDHASLSIEAQRVYAALERRGYSIERVSGEVVRDDDGYLVNADMKTPIFRVSKRAEIDEPLAGAPPPDGDYQIDGPSLRERQQRIDEQRARQAEYDALAPAEQIARDKPGEAMFSFGPRRGPSARELLDDAKRETDAAKEMRKGFEAAANCAARHGAGAAVRGVSYGAWVPISGTASVFFGHAVGAALAVPFGIVAAPFIARTGNTQRYLDNRQRYFVDPLESDAVEAVHRLGELAGLDAPSRDVISTGRRQRLEIVLANDDAEADETGSAAPTPPARGLEPATATERLSDSYVAQRGPVNYEARYSSTPTASGSHVRTSDVEFTPVREAPQSAFEPIEIDNSDDADELINLFRPLIEGED